MAKVPRRPDPEHLAGLDPAVLELPAGTELWRIYFRGGRHPTRWGDFRHVGPVDARFDHHEGVITAPALQARSVLYAAEHPFTCLAEVFQVSRTINTTHKSPWIVAFALTRPLSLLDLTGTFLTRAGASMGLCSGPRSVARAWSQGFNEAYPGVQGLAYPSSMHANVQALVLTDRAESLAPLGKHPVLHRSLDDPALLTILKNAARELGYVLG